MEIWCKWFLHYIKYDKEYAKQQIKCNEQWRAMIWMIYENHSIYYSPTKINDLWTEFIEFIDGNGFVLVFEGSKICSSITKIKAIPG